MKHLDLFSGIGGFALAARWMNWETVGFVEIDSWCQKILTKNFPNIPIYGDIKQFDGTKYRGTVDILTGGFPCQDISGANPNGRGLQGSRSGLWYEMLRISDEIKPRHIIAENVINIRNMGYERVQTDLESIGYKVTTFDIPACSLGLPTMERHIWFIATTNSIGSQRSLQEKIQRIDGITREFSRSYTGDYGRWKLPASRLCGMGERIPNRMDRIKGLGNAINPKVVFELYKAIESMSTMNP